ncbi:energy transducer TonB [Sphingomonas donggukensis]|uniref:Energy transducer TonB n=1 Tax=Sphingomonas donggukensis TaxID=2949093 RepID=A0ABY4TXZ1_9SPHN|nr:energy transducer TonB [Sphingomonas donggukensis]URW76750.1 energy transducer TonB [Sphingomonas donggukensis]
MGFEAGAILIAAIGVASGQVAPASQTPPPAAPQTVQQAYEAATALANARKDAEALAAWTALEPRVAKTPRSMAIVRVRKAVALLRLNRLDEASVAAREGLAGMPTTDATLRADRHNAQMTLGLIDRVALDYPGALAHYREALALSGEPGETLSALVGIVRTGTFVTPAEVLPEAARIETMMQVATVAADAKGAIGAVLSELYLNLGRYDDAKRAAGVAVKSLGGLTLKTSVADVTARWDYALAALKLGRDEEARQYLAYTGAGRSKSAFDPAAQLVSPDCGGDAGITPDDVAVIEFSVDDDGAVSDSAPVWGSRPGAMPIAFARAARGWSWTPEQVKGLPTFYRTRVRVEMRCSTAFARPASADYLRDGLREFLATKGVALGDRSTTGDASRLPALRAAMASAPTGGVAPLSLAPTFYDLIENVASTREESAIAAERLRASLIAAQAPPVALLAAEVKVASMAAVDRTSSESYFGRLAAMRAAQPYASDAEARGILALMMSDAAPYSKAGKRSDIRAYLAQVSNDLALPAAHPLKVAALVRSASLAQAAGDTAAAQAAFAKTGLAANQCALLDKPPAFKSLGNNTFPMEALRWGFEGWGRVQFDIDAKGRTTGQRIVAAFPPFVFGKAAIDTVAASRFEESYRPDGGLGCGGTIRGVVFRLPG